MGWWVTWGWAELLADLRSRGMGEFTCPVGSDVVQCSKQCGPIDMNYLLGRLGKVFIKFMENEYYEKE